MKGGAACGNREILLGGPEIEHVGSIREPLGREGWRNEEREAVTERSPTVISRVRFLCRCGSEPREGRAAGAQYAESSGVGSG
jgi:hypothetical protein